MTLSPIIEEIQHDNPCTLVPKTKQEESWLYTSLERQLSSTIK